MVFVLLAQINLLNNFINFARIDFEPIVYIYIGKVQQLGKAYNKELKWVMERQMPSFQEYAKNSEITSVVYLMFASITVGLKSVTQQTIDWVKNGPNLVLPTTMIGRYYDDVGSHEVSLSNYILSFSIIK